MRTYIHKLRQKPDAHKKHFALTVAGGVTLIIFTIWISTFSVRFSAPVQAQNIQTGESPFSAIRSNFATGIEGVMDAMQGIKRAFGGR
jgi:hypothetical protein